MVVKIDQYKFYVAMAKKEISVSELSQKVGLSAQTINNVKSGRRGMKPERLGKVAKVLGVDVTELLERKENT